jgi:acetyl-CoA carboxylase biotin carboxyl carrier protein
MSDIKAQDIEALLETFEASSWSQLRLKVEGLELFVSKNPGARWGLGTVESAESIAPTVSPTQDMARSAPHRSSGTVDRTTVSSLAAGLTAVRAPNLGTFYRSPKPGAPPYVEVGQRVEPTTELCLIEVMKLFTSVHAGVAGVVRHVLVNDAELVEFDQTLFLIEADGS